ncbi:MAG TPA: ABC transporter permease [Vicinamibacterales bacterium]|nr:ABC transporter permease [Vicinamibacterales bacterium]
MLTWLRRLSFAVRHQRLDADLTEELEFHRGMKQRDVEAAGASPDEARVAATKELGSSALTHDQARDVWHPRVLQGLGHDVRVAFRSLRSSKTVSAVAVLSLALGIGANTAVFSLVDSLVLRALPVIEPQRLALISSTGVTTYRPQSSYATFDAIRRRNLFDSVGAFTTCCSQSTITVGGTRELVYREFFSGDFFQTLGVRAALGRLIVAADDVDGGKPDGQVVVISDRLWRRRFNADPHVVGTPLQVDHASLTIVGVLPANFHGLEVGRTFDIAMPLDTRLGGNFIGNYERDTPILNIVVRRRPAQTLGEATAALRAAQPDIRAALRATLREPFVLEPIPGGTSALRERFQRPLLLMLAVVVFVLLVACANVANLLLARSTARRHELSVRVALGASQWRVARQLLVESAMLSAIGTCAGVLLAPVAVRLIVSELSIESAPVVLDLSLDWRVMVFTAAVMVATTTLFGVVPATRAMRVPPNDALQDRQAGASVRRGRVGVLDSLIVVQVALSLAAVISAGLFVRTFEQLARVKLGFDRDGVLGVVVNSQNLPADGRNDLNHRLARAAASVPGVAAAGGSINPPLAGFLRGDLVVSARGTVAPTTAERIDRTDFVTPGMFAAYGVPILAGRDVDDRDTLQSPKVMIVNRAFANRFLPGRSAVGEMMRVTYRSLGGDFPVGDLTIVGVVGDTVSRSLRDSSRPILFMPLRQYGASVPQPNLYLAIRSAGPPPETLERSVAAALTAVQSDITLQFQPIKTEVRAALSQDRLLAMLSGFFGGLALLLAALGLYGVTAYAVSRRRLELGIRMALGASPASVVRHVLASATILVSVGLTVGAVVSLWASRFAESFVYGVSARDPITLVGGAAVLSSITMAAAALPALRASAIDPAVTLREQ